MRWLGSAVWNWIYRFPARMVSCGGGRSRLLPFRPLSRRSGCVPALPYPPLRYFQSGSHQPRRARIFHRTATTPLTFCLTGRVHPRLPRYLCPSPTPRWSAVLSDAVRRSRPRDHPGPPLLTQTTFLACCAHYPGGPIRAAGYRYGALPRRVLPDRLSLPRFSAGSATTLGLSRPARALHALRPAKSLAHLSVDFVARFRPGQFPDRTARLLSNLTINYSSGSFPHW